MKGELINRHPDRRWISILLMFTKLLEAFFRFEWMQSVFAINASLRFVLRMYPTNS